MGVAALTRRLRTARQTRNKVLSQVARTTAKLVRTSARPPRDVSRAWHTVAVKVADAVSGIAVDAPPELLLDRRHRGTVRLLPHGLFTGEHHGTTGLRKDDEGGSRRLCARG